MNRFNLVHCVDCVDWVNGRFVNIVNCCVRVSGVGMCVRVCVCLVIFLDLASLLNFVKGSNEVSCNIVLDLALHVIETFFHELDLEIALLQVVNRLVSILDQAFKEVHCADTIVQKCHVAFLVRHMMLLQVSFSMIKIFLGLV